MKCFPPLYSSNDILYKSRSIRSNCRLDHLNLDVFDQSKINDET